MAEKKIAFESEGNHWYWRAKHHLDCQTGTLVTMPEGGTITRLELKVAGVNYNDPVYGRQNHNGYANAAIWNADTGTMLTRGTAKILPISPGGTQPWVAFDLTPLKVKPGQRIIVGLWRRSDLTSYATQWDYSTNAASNGYTSYGHHLSNSANGPIAFSKSVTYNNRALNFRLWYSSGGKPKVWNGRSWTSGDLKVWNGSTWVEGTVRVWDGAEWKEATQ